MIFSRKKFLLERENEISELKRKHEAEIEYMKTLLKKAEDDRVREVIARASVECELRRFRAAQNE